MKTRLEHIFSTPSRVPRCQQLLRILCIAAFPPAVYVVAAAQLTPQGVVTATNRSVHISIATTQQATRWEALLLRDPENLNIRGALMAFYANQGDASALVPHLLWIIHHHPEDPIAAIGVLRRRGPYRDSFSTNEYETLEAAWNNALFEHPDTAAVLFHAGLFMEGHNPKRALDLFTRAIELSPDNTRMQPVYLQASAVIYAAAIMVPSRINNIAMDENLAADLRAEIAASRDPALLCQVGTILVQLGRDKKGLSLIQTAIRIDPTSSSWREAWGSARAEPVRRQNLREIVAR